MRRLLLVAGCLLVCLGSASAAEEYLPANLSAPAILANARAARGALAAGRYAIVERTRGGGIERIRTTRIDGNDSLTVVKSGDFLSAYGVFGGQSWTQDENGLVVLRSEFRRSVDPNMQAVLHPENSAYRVSVRGMTQSQPQEYAVELDPPGGSDQFRYYDAKTFLLDRVVTFDADGYRHVIEYSNYRSEFQSMRAFHVHSYDGRPQNDTVTDTISFERAGSDAAPVTIPASRPLYTIGARAPITIPATFATQGIIVRVTINGRGLDFLVDSGASGLFIDPGVAHELGLSAYGHVSQTIGGDIDISRTRVAELNIGPLRMRNVAFNMAPMSWYAGGSRIVGILGYDFLGSAIVGIDFQKQSLVLYPPPFDPRPLSLFTVPMQIDDGVPRVEASFEGVAGFFLIDTGAMASLVYKAYLRKLKSAELLSQQSYTIGAIGGTVPAELRRVTDLEFGGIRFDEATVFVPTRSTFNLSDYDGVLGRDVLNQYQIFFDYAQRKLYIKPV